MDPVIPILLQAAATFGNAALGDLAKRSVGEAWDAAVGAIKRRFGASHPSAPALVDRLRRVAGDDVLTGAIRDQLEPMQLGQDAEVLAAIDRLAAILKSQVPSQLQATGQVYATTIQGAGQVFGTQHVHFGKDS